MATKKNTARPSTRKPASSQGIITVNARPLPAVVIKQQPAVHPLSLKDLVGERIILRVDEGRSPFVNVQVLSHSACVIDAHDAKSMKGWIEEMIPADLLGDVLQVGLERAKRLNIPVEDSYVRPAPSPILWQKAEATDEAAEPIDAKVIGVDGEFMASVCFNGSMDPACPKDQEIIFRHGVEPKDGDVVLAYVGVTEILPKPRFWQLSKLKAWRLDGERVVLNHLTIRRFGRDASGAKTLTPLVPGFPAWTEGIRDGKRTELGVEGVATDYKATFRERRLNGQVTSVCQVTSTEQE